MKQSNEDFWKKQATDFKNATNAVNFDILEEELEKKELIKIMSDNKKILDLGCGNGRTTIFLAKKFPKSKFIGIDFIQEMIEVANVDKQKEKLENVDFILDSATNLSLGGKFKEQFDIILTKRLLINLHGNLKNNAIQNIYKMLKKDGKYIMIECFKEPLKKINNIRSKISLEVIKEHKFNEYLNEEFLNSIKKYFFIEEKIDFESHYYFISRIYNAYLSKEKIDYLAPINKLSVELSNKGVNPIKGYAPESLRILKKLDKI